jgi:uncharacterized protein (TIGR03435 family)
VNFGFAGGRFSATNAPLREIIRTAFGVADMQMVDAPDWIRSERFDIVAKVPADAQLPQAFLMLRELLSERFALTTRREQRELPVYALVRIGDKPGPELRPAAADCPKLLAASRTGTPLPPSERILCGTRVRPGLLSGGGLTSDQIASALWSLAGRIVIDRTGLEGRYDIDMEFAPEPPAREPSGPWSDKPSLFTALQEQLGLRLEPVRAPVDVLVIEHVERPTPD